MADPVINMQEQIEATREAYNDLFSKAESAVSSLQTSAMSYFSVKATEEGFKNNPTWKVTRGRDASLSSTGALTFKPINFNFDGDLTDMFQAMGLERYSYQSDFFDDFLDPRLRNWIDSQAYFLAVDVQNALFEAMRERDLRTLNDSLAATNRTKGRTGFPLPTDMLIAARGDVIGKHAALQADRNKEVTALIADKALQEKLEAVRSGVQMEDIRSRFQLEYNKLYWQASDFIIRKYDLMLRSELAKIDAELKRLTLMTDNSRFNAELDIKYEQMNQARELARLQVSISEMTSNVQTWMKSAEMRIQAASGAVNFYSQAALGTAGQINLVPTADVSGG